MLDSDDAKQHPASVYSLSQRLLNTNFIFLKISKLAVKNLIRLMLSKSGKLVLKMQKN